MLYLYIYKPLKFYTYVVFVFTFYCGAGMDQISYPIPALDTQRTWVEDTEQPNYHACLFLRALVVVMPFYIAIQKKDPAAGRFTAAEFSLRNISFQVVWQRVC